MVGEDEKGAYRISYIHPVIIDSSKCAYVYLRG